jgi:hypothetical protein
MRNLARMLIERLRRYAGRPYQWRAEISTIARGPTRAEIRAAKTEISQQAGAKP